MTSLELSGTAILCFRHVLLSGVYFSLMLAFLEHIPQKLGLEVQRKVSK